MKKDDLTDLGRLDPACVRLAHLIGTHDGIEVLGAFEG